MGGVGEIRAMACIYVRKGILLCPAHQTYRALDCETCTVYCDAMDNLRLLQELVVEVENVLKYGQLPKPIWTRLASPQGRVREGARAVDHYYSPPWKESS